MQSASDESTSNAFRLLSETVRDFYSRRRRGCLGAPLKLELRRRSYNTFSEQQLGFLKFADFLRSAQQAGIVRVVPTPGGDLSVFPAGVQDEDPPVRYPEPTPVPRFTTAPALGVPLRFGFSSGLRFDTPFTAALASGPVRVRQDLWNAFTSLSPLSWVYDRLNDIAYRSPSASGGVTANNGTALVQIPPGRERTVGWMRSFADTQGEGVRSRLRDALDVESGPYQFNRVIAQDQRLHRAWRRYHVEQVLAAIQAWASANNVRPKDLTANFERLQRPRWPEPQRPTPEPAAVVAPTAPSRSAASALTGRLPELIDELVDELLRLRGALQVVGAKH